MKLIKLSLAAVVAAGAMTTFASAAPLEEAIKDVEISGLARYRFYNQSDYKNYPDGGHERNRFSGLLNITSPVADNLKFGISLATDGNDYPRNGASSSGGVNVDKFWFQYAVNDFIVKVGKMEIPTPWTQAGFAGTRGNGILGLFTGLENWTFAAAYFNQTNGMNDANIPVYSAPVWAENQVSSFDGGLGLGQEDLMAAGAIGKIGPVDLQVWMARMEHAIDYTAFGEVGFSMAGFNIKGQVNYLKLHENLEGFFNDDAGIFFGFQGGYKGEFTDGSFFVDLGYTKTDKDMPVYVLDGDNDGFIKFGQQLYYKTQNNPDTQVFFGRAGANYKKFGAEIGYGFADVGLDDADKDEFYGLLSYQYAKNFGLQLYYSVLTNDSDVDNNELRFQALYNF